MQVGVAVVRTEVLPRFRGLISQNRFLHRLARRLPSFHSKGRRRPYRIPGLVRSHPQTGIGRRSLEPLIPASPSARFIPTRVGMNLQRNWPDGTIFEPAIGLTL